MRRPPPPEVWINPLKVKTLYETSSTTRLSEKLLWGGDSRTATRSKCTRCTCHERLLHACLFRDITWANCGVFGGSKRRLAEADAHYRPGGQLRLYFLQPRPANLNPPKALRLFEDLHSVTWLCSSL